MTAAVRPARLAAAERWVACLGDVRDVRADRVDCPLVRGTVSLRSCLDCHHLLTVADEREGWTACTIGDLRPGGKGPNG